MPAPWMRTQTLSVVYSLLRTAAARKQPVAAVYDGRPRLFCPHLLGKNKKGELRAFCYQGGGESGSGLRTGPDGMGGWRCIAVDKLTQVELCIGAWRTEPRTGQQHCIEQVDFDVEAQSGCDPQNGQ
jgi:hypothetical protein